MSVTSNAHQRKTHPFAIFLSIFLAIAVVLSLTQTMAASDDDIAAAVLSAEKMVDQAQVTVGITSTVEYTIVISNTGDAAATAVVMTDTLASGLTFVGGSFNEAATNGLGDGGESGNVITWTGSLDGGGYATITFRAVVADSMPVGAFTNTAQITGTGTLLTPFAATAVISQATGSTIYLPIIFKSLPRLTLQVTRPNSANEWTASWDDGGSGAVTGYELEESKDPGFGTVTGDSPGNVGTNLSRAFTHGLSTSNTYYYRVRALAGSMIGPWSNVQMAVGGYFDDFDDPSSGWAVRRMSYLEKTDAKYGTGSEAGNLIILTFDKWDWLVASPLAMAPTVPYAIEYRSRPHDPSNLVSGGMAFGGDWNFEACPEYGNVYQTDNCFNRFYNYNFIYSAKGIKLLHEQVDYLSWCPNCGGSPLKRIGVVKLIEEDDIIRRSGRKDWHTYRVEVRADGARLYIDGSFKEHFPNTSYINSPYFGVFASTNEYEPSIWFYDYFKVTPLD